MKVLLILYVLIVFVFSTNILAQSDSRLNVNVDVSTRLIQTIQLTTVSQLSFGQLRPGEVDVYVNPMPDANAGYMIADGTPNSQFRLDYFEQVVLSNGNEDGNLTFFYEISKNNIEEQSTSTLIENNDEVQVFNNEGRFYFWVGGRLNLENATPGNYRGEFKIEIDYI